MDLEFLRSCTPTARLQIRHTSSFGKSRSGKIEKLVTTLTAVTPRTTAAERGQWRDRLALWLPQLILAPSLIASFVYVFVFTGWTFYVSLSNSSLLPSYDLVGFEHYVSLWQNRRWNIAYTNLFIFSILYVIGTMAIGLLLAILIDQRVRGESVWRTIYLYPLAVSFVVTGLSALSSPAACST